MRVPFLVNYFEKNSSNLNFKFIELEVCDELKIANSSSESELSNCCFDSSGTIPEETSTKHKGGNRTHHQF